MIAQGSFREDLFYRLAEIVIKIPGLSERAGDAPLLAKAFLKRFAAEMNPQVRGFSADALAAIDAWHWPGNVRELENRVKRAVIMADSKLVGAADLDLTDIEGEDEQALNLLLRYNLESEGFEVDIIERGDEAEPRIREVLPDLVILDWMLPGVSGIEICRRLRARAETKQLPILMLTARGEESERVRGLGTGADDYVVKPFSLPELLARVQALLRRSKPEQAMKVLSAGDIELDREKKRVHRAGRELHLGPTEFRLLEFLMLSPGRVFTREQLLDRVDPVDFDGTELDIPGRNLDDDQEDRGAEDEENNHYSLGSDDNDHLERGEP